MGSSIGAAAIRASAEEVLALLDELTFGPASAQGLQDTRQRWVARLEVKKRQRPTRSANADCPHSACRT